MAVCDGHQGFTGARKLCSSLVCGRWQCVTDTRVSAAHENCAVTFQGGLKLNGMHELLAYADDVNILGGSEHTLKENAEALVAATREIGLEVSADKTKYMVMSRDQKAGRNHNVRIDNSTFERVEEFKYLGTTLRNQNSILE